jgi:hypothetical protein
MARPGANIIKLFLLISTFLNKLSVCKNIGLFHTRPKSCENTWFYRVVSLFKVQVSSTMHRHKSASHFGLALGKAEWKEVTFIHVATAPVLNTHEKVLPPTITLTLGLILYPLNGVIRLKILLHVVIEMVHKFKTNWGMILGALKRGVMRQTEKPRGDRVFHYCLAVAVLQWCYRF